MNDNFLNATEKSYNNIAETYQQRISDELTKKPFDRKMLQLLIEHSPAESPLCDMGCGPGHIGAYLQQQGATVTGIDLSPGMIAAAQKSYPDITFQTGNMLALTDVADNTFGGMAAFYSIIHIPPERVVDALREFCRILADEGVLLLTFHIGSEILHRDDMWEHPVNLDFYFYETAFMKNALQEAGFMLLECIDRDPYPEAIEAQTRRAYLFAKKITGTS